MLVTVFCAPRDLPETTFALDVSPELELRDFVALCELESGIPAGEIQITYVEQPLKDPTRALATYGVKDGDVVVLRQADRRPPPTQSAFRGLPHIDFRSITVPGTSSSSGQRGAIRPQQQAPQQPPPPPQQQQQQPPPPPQPQLQQPQQQQRAPQSSTPAALRGSNPQGLDDPALLQQMLLSNPHELSLLKERNPPLAEALLSGDLERFTKVLLEQQQDRAKREQERIRLLTADPFDLDAQAKIEEDIRQHNVEENMTIAMEEAPESFGQVVMLYINCRVNGHPVKAFVDSGAQMTIMSQACAERCNIMRLVDRRWAGIAKGVGTQKIIGRVHLAQVQIEGDFLPCSFSILEDQPMDMLLGLDMLKRHQCSIDLKKNVLLIGTTGTETRFLSEAELPECARLAYGAEGREEARPDEMADRELAEALQRSIQESDTADGQTTSPQPKPFVFPRPLDQKSPPIAPSQSHSSGRAHNPNLDRSQSAPCTMKPAEVSEHSMEEMPSPAFPAADAATTPHHTHRDPEGPHCISEVPPLQGTSTDVLLPVDVTGSCQDPGDTLLLGSPEAGCQSDEGVNSSTDAGLEDISSIQPMEQAAADSPNQPDSLEMDDPVVASSTSDQLDGDHCSSSDSIPSLAAALKELHQLLVSNSQDQSQNRSSSCSPSHPLRQDTVSGSITPPGDSQPTSSTAIAIIAEPNDAKLSFTAASDEEPTPCCLSDSHRGNKAVQSVETEGVPTLSPVSSEETWADGCEQSTDSNVSNSLPELEEPVTVDVELREPPEDQDGRGASDGPVHNTNTQTEPMATSSADDASRNTSSSSPALAPVPSSVAPPPARPPPPHPFIGQFPAEHIQRIQAAGFSAREAAEALERAQGVVELALLALLARSITVPT
ncbi:protein DDI1 homolog 2 isoform X1 [Gouania willdenowi]|nr:uncharacterized protein LOC114463848 isoform X1 [Gouania willdenowi]